ncbi:coat protein [Vanilla latent virus]|uniref:Coat protein n=1 Tax=Vanilla latent virus TaxID=2016426 RepID=A0A220NQ79_9VIRU|nr:coat protein [Vanilla latent virus]ASJ78782.1 coat protein [Vanilla latent virus]
MDTSTTNIGTGSSSQKNPLTKDQPPPPTAQDAGETDSLMPTLQELEAIMPTIAANKVATRPMITAILTQVRGQHASATATDLVELAINCMHNGSSRLTMVDGATSKSIPFTTIVDAIKQQCTLRQFCMYYAKVCYNIARERKIPPANWLAKGYSEDTKYAAFDFFAGVMNPASPSPPGGMKYTPSPAEMAASAVNGQMAILEARQQEDQYSTRGNMLAMRQVRATPRPPMITFE